MRQLTSFNIIDYFANTPQITFEVTEKCNLNCVYCGYGKLYSDKDSRSNRNLSVNSAILLLKYIKGLWDKGYNMAGQSYLHISFYGGEPLMNMRLIKNVIEYIEKELTGYGKTIVYSMTTNALLLPQHIDYLVLKNFRLLISLDGDKNGTSYRVFPNGQPAYEQIIKAIDVVRERYPAFYTDNIEFNAVLNDRNTVKSLREFFWTEYNKVPSVSDINTSGINKNAKALFDKIYRNKIESEQEAEQSNVTKTFNESPEYERVARYLQMHSQYSYDDYNELLIGKSKKERFPTGTCLPFAKKIFVTVSGKILPCERIGHKYYLGTIKEDEIHIDFEHIASIYNEYYQRVEKTCCKCHNYSSCLCCMFNNGQLDSPVSKCSFFMDKKDELLERNSIYTFLMKYPEAYSYIMNNYKVK